MGNAVYSVTFENGVEVNPPLFGSQYSFHLEGVVDCPEFLVYLPVMVKLAEKYGLMLIGNERYSIILFRWLELIFKMAISA